MSTAPCDSCSLYFVEWSVPNEVFNLVTSTIGVGYLCIDCFDAMADAKGVRGIGVQFIYAGSACANTMGDAEASRLLAYTTAELAIATSENQRLAPRL